MVESSATVRELMASVIMTSHSRRPGFHAASSAGCFSKSDGTRLERALSYEVSTENMVRCDAASEPCLEERNDSGSDVLEEFGLKKLETSSLGVRSWRKKKLPLVVPLLGG
jgi:hypothetical protein